MRPIPLLTALALALAATPAALAQPAPPRPPLADAPLPPASEDQAQADAMTAELAALDARIAADEARMTTLRNTELAQENARIRAIRPALPFPGPGRLPG